jgi:magnesium chelatase subunit D
MEPLAPWDRVEAALAVLCLDPAGVKGLWLRARSGAVRDRVTDALDALPLPLRRVHPAIDDASLFGGVDLAGTLAAGRVVRSAGVLGQPVAVVLTMAERCGAGLAARLARALDDRGSALIALDEGAEASEALPSALSDRLGLYLDLSDVAWSESAPVALDPWRLTQARGVVVATPADALETLTKVAAAMGIGSLRAPMLALAAARALAAWRGEAVISDDTLRHAAELVLAHRGDVPEMGDNTPPPPPEDGETDAPQQQEIDRLPEDVVLEAVRAALPADVLDRLTAGKTARMAKGSGGTGAARKGNHRGRPLPPRPGVPGSGKRIDLVSTLRAAAPWQPLRRRAGVEGLQIHAADLRLKRYQETSDRVLIFAVDASGSSAFARMAEAKGAVELLLAQAYARRDHVALIAFRGTEAELILPPTRSLVQTKRRLAGLAGGGGTPLASGLRLAFDLAQKTRARGMTPTVALLTDGRGNIALDGSANRELAEADTLRLARALRGAGMPALVIDTANRPQAGLRQLASLLDAPYLALPRADAQRLSGVLQAALGA